MASSRRARVLKWLAVVLAALGVLGGAAFAVGSTNANDGGAPGVVYADASGTSAGQSGEWTAVSPGAGGTTSSASMRTSGPMNLSAQEAQSPDSTERIIHSGSLAIEAPDDQFDRVWDAAVAVAARFDGRVMSSNRGAQPQPDSDREIPTGQITIRVPAASFDRAMEALRALGKVEADSTTGEDVTEEYVDLESQLRNMRAEQTTLIALFEDAKNVRDTLAVQQRLSEVEAEIERVTGRIKFIDDRFSYSRINVQIGEPGAALLVFEQRGPSFARAWDTAWEGLLRIGTGAMIGAIWLAPFAVLLAVVLLVRRRPDDVDEVAAAPEAGV